MCAQLRTNARNSWDKLMGRESSQTFSVNGTKKKLKASMTRSQPCSGESTTNVADVNYLLLAMLLKQPNGQLLVTVDHNQLQTMIRSNWLAVAATPYTGQYLLSTTCKVQICKPLSGIEPSAFEATALPVRPLGAWIDESGITANLRFNDNNVC